MTMIDTPEGIDFARAAARAGALKNEIAFREIFDKPARRSGGGRTAYSIVKQVYGFTGNPKTVLQMLEEYIEGTLEIRGWSEERGKRAADIVNEATRRAEEEYGDTYTKPTIDSNVQAFFESGAITEQEGNDACLLLYVEVVRQHAGRK